MPFKDRGENQTRSPETLEEIQVVEKVISSLDISNYKVINFIGKSLGGLILQRFIEKSKFNTNKHQLTILGYLTEYVDISSLKTQLHIIQGEKDRYGKLDDLNKLISGNPKKDIELSVVAKGDHSYRDENKNPLYQDKAVELIEI